MGYFILEIVLLKLIMSNASNKTMQTIDCDIIIYDQFRKFIANLLKTSARKGKIEEENVRSLIQLLIDGGIEPHDFCKCVRGLLIRSLRSWYMSFLKNNLEFLQDSFATRKLTIDGFQPSPIKVPPSIERQISSIITPSQACDLSNLQGIPREIVLEAMDIAVIFPSKSKSRILSILVNNMNLSSDVRTKIVLKMIFEEMEM